MKLRISLRAVFHRSGGPSGPAAQLWIDNFLFMSLFAISKILIFKKKKKPRQTLFHLRIQTVHCCECPSFARMGLLIFSDSKWIGIVQSCSAVEL